MSKKAYRMVVFTDGDARVYSTDSVTPKVIREWNRLYETGETDDKARTAVLSDDKEMLIAMAKLARHDHAVAWEREFQEKPDHTLVDRTNTYKGAFP